MTKMESLWPEEDFDVPKITAPIVILRQQAYALGQKTRNILEAEVSSHPFYMKPPRKLSPGQSVLSNIQPISMLGAIESKEEDIIQSIDEPPNALQHSFYITAPVLGGYRYRLFTVSHQPISIYPLSISFDGKTSGVNEEEGFRSALRDIFASESTKKVVQALLAQSLSETAS
jgi:hypothetical protein